MPQTILEEVIKALERAGFFVYILPLLLVFSIIYAIMESAEILDRKMRAFIALLSSLFIWYFVNLPALATSFGTVFAGTSMILIVVLSALLVVGLIMPAFGMDTGKLGEWVKENSYIIIGFILFGFGIVFYIFSQTPGWELLFKGYRIPTETLISIGTILAILVGIVIVIRWVTKEE